MTTYPPCPICGRRTTVTPMGYFTRHGSCPPRSIYQPARDRVIAEFLARYRWEATTKVFKNEAARTNRLHSLRNYAASIRFDIDWSVELS